MSYEVKLSSYEGPLDLLLDLIKKHKIDIYDIPIVLVTEQFLAYLYEADKLNMELTSDFILMASDLLRIKSLMLLPKTKVQNEEEEEIDPREELVRKILEYERIKNASEVLKEFEEFEAKAFYKKQEEFYEIRDEDFIKNCDVRQLAEAFNKLLKVKAAQRESVTFNIVQREKYTVDKSLYNIRTILKEKKQFYFTELFEHTIEREELIVTFLSLLEIIKNREAIATQNFLFDDILIISRKREKVGKKSKGNS